MPSAKKILFRTIKLLIVFYAVICLFLYLFQEKLIFSPTSLSKDHRFSFGQPFMEIAVRVRDGKVLNGLLFNAQQLKGLIFYLHGNAGALDTWGAVANRYTGMGYDVFLLDYRGFGKSEGSIRSEFQFFEDVQSAYDKMKERYRECDIIVLGYSIGTGPAARLAADNQPKLLILQAPFFSLTDMMRNRYPIFPTFLLRYKFRTNEYITRCHMPVIIFHGDRDKVVFYGSSLKLKEKMKKGDSLITLRGQGHNGITDNEQYVGALREILK